MLPSLWLEIRGQSPPCLAGPFYLCIMHDNEAAWLALTNVTMQTVLCQPLGVTATSACQHVVSIIAETIADTFFNGLLKLSYLIVVSPVVCLWFFFGGNISGIWDLMFETGLTLYRMLFAHIARLMVPLPP